MITGIGIDLIEVERVEASHQKFGERFLKRILHPNEIAYALSHARPGPFLAARFAAKEAASKALGCGIGASLGWQDMEVCKKDSGEPYIVWHGKGLETLAARGGTTTHLSISHTEKHATAIVVVEGR